MKQNSKSEFNNVCFRKRRPTFVQLMFHMTVLTLVKRHTKNVRCNCKLLTVYIISTETQTIYKYVYFRSSQPAKHHDGPQYLRHQQPGILRLRLACSVLRTDGHYGCDLRTDGAAVTQKGTIRGRASRI